jgi:methyl-accepting chemotaxis protein
MREKILSILVALIILNFIACSKQHEPTSEKAKHIEALVNEAAALIQIKGKAAFSEFRVKGTKWFTDEIYIFVDDFQGVVLVNPPNPEIEGKNFMDFKDATGKLLTKEMIALLESKEAGWIDYMWPKPGESEPSNKWSYIRKVTIEEESFIVGAGFYAE